MFGIFWFDRASVDVIVGRIARHESMLDVSCVNDRFSLQENRSSDLQGRALKDLTLPRVKALISLLKDGEKVTVFRQGNFWEAYRS
jgi:hypothetical protein